ncbi:(+)-neomenthol dehydrogenase [Glycine max]|nr:(+)-neomenthol dehydrogenase [Glycine max]
MPLLQLSDSPRIVNVSSSLGQLESLPKGSWARGVFNDVDNLTAEIVDEILNKFLRDFKEGSLESKGWPKYLSAYIVSKAAMNAYTRILAKKYPSFCINSVCPGYVKTDITANTGILTVEEGAASPVRLALLPNGSPSGFFYYRSDVASYAVVTGANKGIGLEIVRQLASAGIKVVLTARNEERGIQALQTLKDSGLSHLVLFHQVDVADATSVASLADFIKSKFGKLDILAAPEEDVTKAITQSYELAEECLQINYYGAKTTVESLLPLLQLSDSPRIVNVSSTMGQLESLPKGSWAREVFSDANIITEEKVDEILKKFLRDFQEGSLESNGWPRHLGAYIVSKAAMNAYTRILAKKYPSFCINSVCPGYVKTDITANTGLLTVEEGAASPVRLALLPNGSPSGLFYYRSDSSSTLNIILLLVHPIHPDFNHNNYYGYAVVTGANKGIGLETVKGLASNGIKVVLTARDVKRGYQAVEELKREFGFSDLVVFHQLDVTDPSSIASLVEFVKTHFGRLDILVNNAGISGFNTDGMVPSKINWKELPQTYEMAEKCLTTNYYGAKETTEAFLPLLRLSNLPMIVNVSSEAGLLKYISNEWARSVLDDTENLTEELIDEVLKEYMTDLEDGLLEKKGWPTYLSAYMVSKAAINSYTRLLAYRHQKLCINCVCPGFVKTDINRNTGILSVENGAASVVRLALLPNGSPSGHFFTHVVGKPPQLLFLLLLVFIFEIASHSNAYPLSTHKRLIIDEATGQRAKLVCGNWAGHLKPMIPEGLD